MTGITDNLQLFLDLPDGIKKLRELILTLAMQGKLVPQDPNDQPASELLKEIEAEKKRLVKEGKIKKQEHLPSIKPEEIPYSLPRGWEWVRLGMVAQHNTGKTLDGGRNQGEMREYITTSNLYWGYFHLENLRKMPFKEEELAKCVAIKNDLLVCEGGEAGRAAVWSHNHDICIQNHIHRVRFYYDVNPNFIYNYFEKINHSGEIERYRKGVAIKSISGRSLGEIILPLPPLSEQKRIVDKIDELMVLCDQLEALKAERDQKRVTVHTVAIQKLLSSPDPVSFDSSWQFITRHFNELYSVKENVAELRKAILQLAVMGKLVPQDPNDQPASELLKEIEAEKKRLMKEGKIKKQEPLPPIKPEEIPYSLPKGWEWVRLGEVGEINPRNKINDELEVGFVTMANISEKFGESYKFQRKKWSEIKSGFTHFAENDVSLAKITPCFENGKSCVFEGLPNGVGAGTTELHIFRNTYHGIFPKYLLLYLKSPNYIRIGISKMTGSAGQKRLPTIYFSQNPFPLPPITEQKRIVEKVDQLMALCDQIEGQFGSVESKKSELVGALLAGV